jgi:hypothetical protein
MLNGGINLESDATIERVDNSEGQGTLWQIVQ